MKKLTVLLFSLSLVVASAAVSPDSLYDGFVNPPNAAKSRVWWHWMNGNVTKEGVTADLEAMAKAGLGGATILDCGISIPAGKVTFNTKEWDEMVFHAADECQRLGLELTIANCSGYSSSGGPWIAPSNAMKFVVTTEARVKGGERLSAPLAPKVLHEGGFYDDIATLAFPLPTAEAEAGRARLTVTNPATNEFLIAADRDYSLYGFAMSETHNVFMWTQCAEATIETSADGRTFAPAATVRATVTVEGHNECCGGVYKTVALRDPVKGRFFRVRFAFPGKAPDNHIVVTGFRADPRTGLTDMSARTYRTRGKVPAEDPVLTDDRVVKAASIVDLTDRLDRRTGRLDWTAPAGDWAVLRIGYASNGAGPGPTSDGGKGLEVDKFDADAVARHFDAYMGKYARHPAVVATLVDSYEVGCQNWTQGFEKTFARKYGYSIVPYLVCLSERVVESAQRSDRVFRDLRRLCADLFAENYAGTMTRKCHEAGIRFAVEPYGNSPADNTSYAMNCDIPMTEFWVRPTADSLGYEKNSPFETHRGIAGVAHFWGKPVVDAEAFTANASFGGRWLKDPFGLKAVGDYMYAAGVQRMVYHRWAQQPWVKPARLPGMTMGPWGTHFERTETWWPMVGPWLKYQQRCQHLLREGRFVADYVHYLGDDAPNSTQPEKELAGHPWDVCGREGLAALKVRDGALVSPGGMTYRALILPSKKKGIGASSQGELARLKASGATILPFDAEVKSEVDFTYSGDVPVRNIHRRYDDGRDGYFVAYAATNAATVVCSFRQRSRFPQIWDAESGKRWRPRAWKAVGSRTEVTLTFEPCGSWFVLFADREDTSVPLEPRAETVRTITVNGPWKLSFPAGWGCPEKPYDLKSLRSWTELGGETQYFSGIATYETSARGEDLAGIGGDERVILDLGEVKNVAEVTVNGKTFPPLWRPPFELDITDSLGTRPAALDLSVRVANLWPNRLIGDAKKPMDHACRTNDWERGCIAQIPDWVWSDRPSPTGRYTFTTWDHWRADEPLLPSGLLGPVTVRTKRE